MYFNAFKESNELFQFPGAGRVHVERGGARQRPAPGHPEHHVSSFLYYSNPTVHKGSRKKKFLH